MCGRMHYSYCVHLPISLSIKLSFRSVGFGTHIGSYSCGSEADRAG